MRAREIRAGLFVFGAVVLASALGGALWAWLAPPEQLLVVEAGRGAALTGESAHRFDGVGIYMLIGAVIGALAAAGTWRWRSMRGPVLQVGLLLGCLLGAVVMAKFGEQVAELLYPRPRNPAVGQIVTLPPEVVLSPDVAGRPPAALPLDLGAWMACLIQPLLASAVVFFLAVLSPTEDLGSGRRRAFGADDAGASTFVPYGPPPSGPGYRPVGEESARDYR
ncbi:DUF2567 domain-containing protein [Nocardia panacis]|uniref:DUF2567 domain-containing protein n=1 Tax=Nocardia panacis TaxID=2340916 RepID=UPI001EEFAF8B|nr:DUF2567 domain-containing protein [Nocardia panacis]